MHNNKVYTILQHFDKDDFKQFNKYINSPYFNRSKLLIKFYDLLDKQLNSKNPDEFPKEKFWKKLFPEQGYNDVRFRKLCSDLLRLVESFLSQQIFDESVLQKDVNLIESVGKKGIEKYYQSAMRAADNNSQKYPYEDSDFYLNQYQIQKNYYEIIQHGFNHSERQNLEEIDNYLNNFYLSEKLRYYCAMLSQKQRGTHDYSLSFINSIINLVKENRQNLTPSLAIYYQIYLTYIEEENEEHYFVLKDLLKNHGLKFRSIEAKSLYDSAINYCAKKLNQGKNHFLEEVFDVYNDYLNKEAIYIDGELDPFHLKNIVTVALRLEKYEWTENFLNQIKDKLPESSRENAFTFNLAKLFWYKKDHGKVISLLQEVEYEDVVYNLSAKAMLLATYYETDEIEALYSLLESFRAYLNRSKKLTDIKKRNYSNLIKFTKKLVKVLPGDKDALDKIKYEMKETKDIADEKWLKEKIAELEK